MKKMISLIIMMLLVLMFPYNLKAPVMKSLMIIESEPLYAFNIKDPVLRAFVRFESFYDEYAINPVSGARGILQFLPVMINEVNRILLECYINHPLYTWDDAFDAQKSIDMWYIVQRYHNPTYDIEKICQIWFGLGVQYDGLTWIEYHKIIQEYL
jgi:hypothetical protein